LTIDQYAAHYCFLWAILKFCHCPADCVLPIEH
jgi:hypothetical protein